MRSRIDADPRRRAVKRERYGPAYRAAHAAWKEALNGGVVLVCPRCGRLLSGAMAWDLDHLDSGELHPSHARCNRSAGGKRSSRA